MGGARAKDRNAPGKGFEAAVAAVARLIRELRLPGAIIGGVAVNAHGVPRFTADIDAAVQLPPAELGRLVRLAGRCGLRPRLPDAERFAAEHLVLLLEHVASRVPVDVSLALQPFEQEALAHAVSASFGSARIRVPTVTDLLIYKMIASRPVDLKDVEQLLRSEAQIDPERIAEVLRETDAILDRDSAREFQRVHAAVRG